MNTLGMVEGLVITDVSLSEFSDDSIITVGRYSQSSVNTIEGATLQRIILSPNDRKILIAVLAQQL